MNDLEFIFYHPSKMLCDTIGMSKEGKIAHRQLCDWVWIQDGPPQNDNDILRDITSCTTSDWGKVKRELLGKGWIETPKFFLHRGVIKTLNESKAKYVASKNQTAAANKLPRLKLLPPDPETGVTHYVTDDVTPTVTPGQEQTNQRQHKQRQETKNIEHQLKQSPPETSLVPSRIGIDTELVKLMISKSSLDRIVGDILKNKHGWHYDNCKVKPGDFLIPKSLKTKLEPFVDKITEKKVHIAWREAVTATHQAVVDEIQVGSIAGYCITIWEKNMKKEIDAAPSHAEKNL